MLPVALASQHNKGARPGRSVHRPVTAHVCAVKGAAGAVAACVERGPAVVRQVGLQVGHVRRTAPQPVLRSMQGSLGGSVCGVLGLCFWCFCGSGRPRWLRRGVWSGFERLRYKEASDAYCPLVMACICLCDAGFHVARQWLERMGWRETARSGASAPTDALPDILRQSGRVSCSYNICVNRESIWMHVGPLGCANAPYVSGAHNRSIDPNCHLAHEQVDIARRPPRRGC